MHFRKGFSLTNKFLPLLLIPIILDLLQLGDILRSIKDFHISFTIPSAIPSISQVLPQTNQLGYDFGIALPFAYVEGDLVLLFLVLFAAVGSFLKGGFIGCIVEGVRERAVNINVFMTYAKAFFVRFLLQILLIFAVLMAVFFLGWILSPLRILLAVIVLIGGLILVLYLFFWDYIIVAEDQRLIEAASYSIEIVGGNLKKVISFILPVILFSVIFSMIANAMVANSLMLAVVAIVIFAYVSTAIIFAIMSFLLELIGEEHDGQQVIE